MFRYSKRENTPAAMRDDQVAPEIKARRAKELELVAAQVRSAERAARAGMRESVLVETDGVATTESYYAVEAPSGASPGMLVECILD